MAIETILYAVIASIAYSLTHYFKKAKKDEPQAFDPSKLLSTAAIGALIGIAFAASGVEVSQLAVEQQLVAYAGLVAVVENVLKAGYRIVKKK